MSDPAAACKNLVWHAEVGYYRCSLPEGHLTACKANQEQVAHDDEISRRLLAEVDHRASLWSAHNV